MLRLTNIGKTFGEQTILEGVNLEVGAKSRIGLIGRNGCGKSTLLRIIMGQMEANEGNIYRAPGLLVNCLSQEPQITPGNTLEAELRSVFSNVNQLIEEEAELLKQLENPDPDSQLKVLDRLDQVHQEMDRRSAHDIDAKINRMVTGLGFSLDELSRNVELFSGGWQMRINLAKVLLEGAEILLLDEPTNHLDLEACEWLEDFLANYPGGIVVVSHDRRFLDRIVTEVAEVELGKLTLWHGNYSRYLTQKADFLETLTSAADRQQKELAKQTAFVDRFRASATKSTQAKSREKQLQKIERIEAPKTDTTRMKLHFPVPNVSGREVLTLKNVSKGFGSNILFQKLDAQINRGQRVFLLGVNGCGKTTLLRLIMEQETPDLGEIWFGHNVIPGYFSQNQLDTLNPESTAFETIHGSRPDLTHTEVRGMLGLFLFTGDEVFKRIESLSGGEKSKVALARLMLAGPNLLLLDEPTNHMDIPAKEVLEGAFKNYEGSLLCISHDRYFIQQVATDIWEIYEGQLLTYPGGFDYYLEKRDEVRAARMALLKKQKRPHQESQAVSEASPPLTPLKEKREIEKRVSKIEKMIMALESEIETLQLDLSKPSLQEDFQALKALGQLIGEKQTALQELNTEWETLTSALV